MAGHSIRTRREIGAFPLLFDVVDLTTLPPALRELHRVIDLRRWSGIAMIDRGTGLLSRMVGGLMRFPSAGRNVPVTVEMERKGGTERWTRSFGPHRFRSTLRRPSTGPGLVERFGPLSFRIALQVAGGALHYPVVQGWCLGVPLPRWALPVSRTVEAVDDLGRATFDVELTHPLTGLIVRYQGWLADSHSLK